MENGRLAESEPWLNADELRWFTADEQPADAAASRGRLALRHVEASLGDLSRAAAAALAPPPLVDAGGAIALPALGLPSRRHERGYRDTRRQNWSPGRRKRFATRFVPAATLVVSAAVTLPSLLARDDRGARISAAPQVSPQLRDGGVSSPVSPRTTGAISAEAPPAESLPPFSVLGLPDFDLSGTVGSAEAAPGVAAATTSADAVLEPQTEPATPPASEPRYEKIVWRESEAHGVPFGGHLHDGVALPVEGRDWITWDPANDQVPNRAWRLHGTDKLVRTVVRIARAHRAANPGAPPLLIGDLSATEGGPLDHHVSHQNGLDVDIYYPRLDRKPLEPTSVDQIDLALAQDLVDRFAAAGAQFIFVGYNTPLSGLAGRVQPYRYHDNHLHVRLYP